MNSSNDGKSRAKSSVEVSNSNKKRNQSEKWCELHRHETTDFKVVQEQISKIRLSWDTVRPASKFKYKNTANTYQKKEVKALVKESIKHMFNAKRNKMEKVHATAQKKDYDSDFEMDYFFKDISESDNDA
jgi:hypothetical protein